MDEIDWKILQQLKKQARLTNKEMGQMIHMSGQGVGQRISNLIDQKVIERFTIEIKNEKKQIILVYLNEATYQSFEQAILAFEEVIEFYQVSGESCYTIIASFEAEKLNQFIAVISKYGRYKVNTIMNKLR
ncbi:Lrp/AsnC family transcriptional regulator [Isobaculum melis]|uniref:DNA-binding transcriptional regulator, Lrp family n=1 Tax=Isobaculum melis TaxID=142588 RepID=A0A1H9TXM3_9LACT|nr:AsnC family transcriptional regulator [Isobaculum melis]SES01667.1 DNA-binding transcriptional regulator, Lrp family [Isobaculum melis]